jgi:hypothetical protein
MAEISSLGISEAEVEDIIDLTRQLFTYEKTTTK